MRFFSVTPRIVIGENSSVSVICSFLAYGHHCPGMALGRIGAGKCLLLLCGALGGFGLRLGWRRLGRRFRRRTVAAHRPPGVQTLLFRYVAERPPVGPLGVLLGRDFRRCLGLVVLAIFGRTFLGRSRPSE